jgi:hypothetical protein
VTATPFVAQRPCEDVLRGRAKVLPPNVLLSFGLSEHVVGVETRRHLGVTIVGYPLYEDGGSAGGETAVPENSPAVSLLGIAENRILDVQQFDREGFSVVGETAAQPGMRFFPDGREFPYGQDTSGGNDIRIASTLPPVFRPKIVPRS